MEGTIYRVTTLKYPDPQEIVSGAGSYRYGGRWNAIESESENQKIREIRKSGSDLNI